MYRRFAGVISLMFALSLVAWTGAYAQDDDSLIEQNVDNSFNTNVDGQYQSQNCSVIINQYNNAIAGDAVAGDTAVAQTAAAVNAPVNVVQNCIQAGGDVIIGDTPDDDPPTKETVEETEKIVESKESEVLAATIPNKVLANTGGISPLLPVSAALIGAGLLGFGIIRRR